MPQDMWRFIYMINPRMVLTGWTGEVSRFTDSNPSGTSTYEFMNLCEGGKRNAKKR
jgi:hypothetical protein